MAKNSRFWVMLLACGPGLAWPAVLAAQPAAWKFAVFGDCITYADPGVNTNIVRELAAAVANERVAFLVLAGDFSFWGDAAGLQAWTNAASPLCEAGIPVFPVVGNHDLADMSAYTNIVAANVPTNGPPGEERTTYALTYSNALLLMINNFAPSNLYRLNQTWVDQVLATNAQPHVFVIGHVPAFKVYHNDCLGTYVTNRDVFWNSLSNAHCQLYLSGHDHF
ncbi:MAG TPA: metallophosphoesterase, partial [Verrucomicrobiae bacterium]